jgi:hypothetical protein
MEGEVGEPFAADSDELGAVAVESFSAELS